MGANVSVAIKPCRVLVVDDDPIFRQLCVTRLRSGGHTVDEAEDGLVGWNLLKTGIYDLAMVDLDMPNMNGFSVLQCARSFPATQEIPMVVITTREDARSVQKSLEAGATGFLTKPINWSMFMPHVNHLLRLAAAANEARVARSEATSLAHIRGSITEILNTELRARSRRIAATAKRALDEYANGSAAEKLRDALGLALTEAEAQRSVVEQLAPYANMITDLAHTTSEVVEIVGLVNRVASELADTASERGVELTIASAGTMAAHAPRNILARTLSDVVKHAILRTPRQGRVSINFQTEGEMLQVSVTDQGAQLAMELAAILGDGGEARAAPVRPLGTNAEIGALMASSLLRMIGGRLFARPAAERGATLVLEMPANTMPKLEESKHVVPERHAV